MQWTCFRKILTRTNHTSIFRLKTNALYRRTRTPVREEDVAQVKRPTSERHKPNADRRAQEHDSKEKTEWESNLTRTSLEYFFFVVVSLFILIFPRLATRTYAFLSSSSFCLESAESF